MSGLRLSLLTLLALLAFAGNSLLCRLALRSSSIDAATFTTLRLLAGALSLQLIVGLRGRSVARAGSWPSALALFLYASAFSFAYRSLTAATGALLLFGAVQATMIGSGLGSGESFSKRQLVGFLLALAGLTSFLLPGLEKPPLLGCLLMLGAGAAWGVYSLRGRGAGNPIDVTAGNFLRAAPIAVGLSLATWRQTSLDALGFWYAVTSGALASGIGYVAWYAALPGLSATRAASLQLSVPVFAALGGVLLLDEPLGLRLLAGSGAVLGGIALAITASPQRAKH